MEVIWCFVRFLFFFSSRRRHTRWNCDWSSDVCSSDLLLRDHRNSSYCGSRTKVSESGPQGVPPGHGGCTHHIRNSFEPTRCPPCVPTVPSREVKVRRKVPSEPCLPVILNESLRYRIAYS